MERNKATGAEKKREGKRNSPQVPKNCREKLQTAVRPDECMPVLNPAAVETKNGETQSVNSSDRPRSLDFAQ